MQHPSPLEPFKAIVMQHQTAQLRSDSSISSAAYFSAFTITYAISQEEAGAKVISDLVFVGICTWFIDIAPEAAASISVPCKEDPNNNGCEFANHGK